MKSARAVVVQDSLADEQAAMYRANPMSAYVLVREVLKASRAGWVLITAAGSALGKSVVRMGKRDDRLVVYVTLADSPLEIPSRDLMMPLAQLAGLSAHVRLGTRRRGRGLGGVSGGTDHHLCLPRDRLLRGSPPHPISGGPGFAFLRAWYRGSGTHDLRRVQASGHVHGATNGSVWHPEHFPE